MTSERALEMTAWHEVSKPVFRNLSTYTLLAAENTLVLLGLAGSQSSPPLISCFRCEINAYNLRVLL